MSEIALTLSFRQLGVDCVESAAGDRPRCSAPLCAERSTSVVLLVRYSKSRLTSCSSFSSSTRSVNRFNSSSSFGIDAGRGDTGAFFCRKLRWIPSDPSSSQDPSLLHAISPSIFSAMLLTLSRLVAALSAAATLSLARPTSDLASSSLSKRNNGNTSSGSAGPTVEIKNGTVEGVRIDSFAQEGKPLSHRGAYLSLRSRASTRSFPRNSLC